MLGAGSWWQRHCFHIFLWKSRHGQSFTQWTTFAISDGVVVVYYCFLFACLFVCLLSCLAGSAFSIWTVFTSITSNEVHLRAKDLHLEKNVFPSMTSSCDHVFRFIEQAGPLIGWCVQQILRVLKQNSDDTSLGFLQITVSSCFLLHPPRTLDSFHRFSLILALPLQMNQIVGLHCNMNHHFQLQWICTNFQWHLKSPI